MIAYVRGRQLPYPSLQSTLVTWPSGGGGGTRKLDHEVEVKKNRIFEQYLFL